MQSQRLAAFAAHPLHAPDRNWPETNCYVDLWIEVLAERGFLPEAMLGFTVRLDFEGDQFTFFKVPLEDLELLYGISVQELAVFDDLEEHLALQLSKGRLPLIEVDGMYLPDTDGVSYRHAHSKTTIAPILLDRTARYMEYFHNAGLFALNGEDYDGIFRKLPHLRAQPDLLFPYVEFAKFGTPTDAQALSGVAMKRLKYHCNFKPETNPIGAYMEAFPRHAEELGAREAGYFHTYAFNTLRQLGANFELLGSHLNWLMGAQGIDFAQEIGACNAIAGGAKAFQFQLARGIARNKLSGLEAQLAPMTDAYDVVFKDLSRKIG